MAALRHFFPHLSSFRTGLHHSLEKNTTTSKDKMVAFLAQARQIASPVTARGVFTRILSKAAFKTIYEPLPKKRGGESAASYLQKQLLKKYDPSGKRSALVDPSTGVRAGDSVKVTYNDNSTVYGRVLGVKRGQNNLGTNILLRNRITRVGCEVRIPVFNPKIANIEIIDKPEKYLSRSKHFYVRNTKYDVGDVEALMRNKAAEAKKAELSK